MNIDTLLEKTENYFNMAVFAYIRKLPNGQYRVFSENGRNLGTYDSKNKAKERLKQIEFFKHKDKNSTDDVIDLTDADGFSYSAIMRKLRQQASKEQVLEFLKLFKKYFDNAIKNNLQKPERVALQNAIVDFGKNNNVKISSELVKNAAISELGESAKVGKYLADIIRFTLTRIKPESRPKSIMRLKHKIYNLNENEIANKKLPASSSMGQSITFVKHVLFNHNPHYIREVLNNIVRNL